MNIYNNPAEGVAGLIKTALGENFTVKTLTGKNRAQTLQSVPAGRNNALVVFTGHSIPEQYENGINAVVEYEFTIFLHTINDIFAVVYSLGKFFRSDENTCFAINDGENNVYCCLNVSGGAYNTDYDYPFYEMYLTVLA